MEAETKRSVIPAQAGIQFFLLDSGSRPTALPGMTGCHECPARVEDCVSEQSSEGSRFFERFFGLRPQNDKGAWPVLSNTVADMSDR